MKKIVSLESLAKIVLKLKSKGKKIVLCHGVFDLLHVGHIRHFEEAKNLGDILVITLTPALNKFFVIFSVIPKPESAAFSPFTITKSILFFSITCDK